MRARYAYVGSHRQMVAWARGEALLPGEVVRVSPQAFRGLTHCPTLIWGLGDVEEGWAECFTVLLEQYRGATIDRHQQWEFTSTSRRYIIVSAHPDHPLVLQPTEGGKRLFVSRDDLLYRYRRMS